MSTVETASAASARTGSRSQEVPAAAAVGVVVALLAQLPVLVNPKFYFWDDSAAQFLPMWHKLGERLLAGQWPALLEPDSWMGGNVAGEALFGVWNPLHLAEFLLVVAVGDLAVAAALVKTQFLVLLGVGTHLLCREYGSSRAMAAVFGVALPISGFVLYFQAASWAGGLMGLAWVPWAWWAARRTCHRRGPLWAAFVAGYLCVSAGDPYAVLALVLVFAGLLAEFRFTRVAGTRRLCVVATSVGLTVPLVFWPVLATTAVGWRTGFVLFNVGMLAPDPGDLLNLSLPGFVPQIRSFGSFRMTVPAMYFAWFVVPLLAWLDWRAFARRAREFAGPLIVAGCAVLLCLGPSQVGLFRWPLRHLPLAYLALSVVFAVVVSAGLRRDRAWWRWSVTIGVLVLCGYLSFAAWPSLWFAYAVSLLLMGGLLAIALRVRLMPLVLQAGTVAALVLQLCWFPANRDVADYNFPSDVRRLREDFAGLRTGTVVQIADRAAIPPEDIASGTVWRHLLFGNMHAAAGVPSLVSYTGIGHRALHDRLCLGYFGAHCPDAYRRLWTVDETGESLADQLKVRHVVVQRRLIDAPVPPAGWHVVQRNDVVTRLERVAVPAWPDGRVGASRGVRVESDVERGARAEDVRFSAVDETGGQVVFARLAWPGYQATVDGSAVPVRATSAGLVEVSVPAGSRAGSLRLTWNPPGYPGCLVLAVSGAVLAVLGSRKAVWS